MLFKSQRGFASIGVLSLVVGLSLASCWPDPPPSSGFVQRSGTTLTADGQAFHANGYNIPWIAPSCGGASDSWMDQVFPDIAAHSKAKVVRATVANTGNFTAFDRYVVKAKKYGLRIVPALTDNWGQCGDGGSEKLLPWYQSGYKTSYRQYAIDFANRYKSETAVAWYQLVNEPDARSSGGGCDETAGKTALRNFADDVGGAIKAVDPNHMVDLGAISWCGGQGADYGYVTAGKVDLCDVHHDYVATDVYPSSEANEITQCVTNNGKPAFVGEAGIHVTQGSGSSLQTRADQFQKKTDALFQHGGIGYVYWLAVHGCSGSSDSFSIGASQNTSACTPQEVDPSETVLASHG